MESRSIVKGTLSAPVLRGRSGVTTAVQSMTTAASGLVARRSRHGLLSCQPNIPLFFRISQRLHQTPHSLQKVTVLWHVAPTG